MAGDGGAGWHVGMGGSGENLKMVVASSGEECAGGDGGGIEAMVEGYGGGK